MKIECFATYVLLTICYWYVYLYNVYAKLLTKRRRSPDNLWVDGSLFDTTCTTKTRVNLNTCNTSASQEVTHRLRNVMVHGNYIIHSNGFD